MQEGEPNFEGEKPKEIKDAQHFDQEGELYEILRRKEFLMGTGNKKYTADTLIERINDVRTGKKPIETITRAEGLREKVVELLEKENKA